MSVRLVLYNSFDRWGWLDTIPEKTRNTIEIVMGDVRDPNGMRAVLKGCDSVHSSRCTDRYSLLLSRRRQLRRC